MQKSKTMLLISILYLPTFIHTMEQNISIAENEFECSLKVALEQGNFNEARNVLKSAHSPSLDYQDIQNLETIPDIQLAILHTPALRQFLNTSQDNQINIPNSKGNTALHEVVELGQLQSVQLLLEHKADPNQLNVDGFTPLHLAAREGKLRMAELLLQYNADIDIPNTKKCNYTALHCAIEGFHWTNSSLLRKMASLLVKQGALLRTSECCVTPLQMAYNYNTGLEPTLMENEIEYAVKHNNNERLQELRQLIAKKGDHEVQKFDTEIQKFKETIEQEKQKIAPPLPEEEKGVELHCTIL